jgi:hypothetical protein
MTGVEAIVAINIDPENQHRIKVVIPMIDENLIFDKWVRPMGVDVGEPGFGSFFVPALKSEVILCGRLGQKHNLFYESSYNEDFEVAPDFRNEDGASGGGTVCGVRSPGDMKLIAEHDMQLRMGRAHIEADATIRLLAPGGVFINDRRIG